MRYEKYDDAVAEAVRRHAQRRRTVTVTPASALPGALQRDGTGGSDGEEGGADGAVHAAGGGRDGGALAADSAAADGAYVAVGTPGQVHSMEVERGES